MQNDKIQHCHMKSDNTAKKSIEQALDYELSEHCLIHGSRETVNVRMSNGSGRLEEQGDTV